MASSCINSDRNLAAAGAAEGDDDVADKALDARDVVVAASGSRMRLRLVPEFNGDDGLNGCVIDITQPSGITAKLRFFQEVTD